MERFRNMSGLLSIVVMFVLAVALSAMVNQPDNDQQKPQPATTESKVAKPQGSMALASVVLPPPPAPANKPKRSEETRGARPKQPLANISPPIPRASAAKVVSIDPATESDGRTLLRMLEIGKGPAIEIAWPAETDQRDQLYQIFINCFGMKAALLDIQDRLSGLFDRHAGRGLDGSTHARLVSLADRPALDIWATIWVNRLWARILIRSMQFFSLAYWVRGRLV